MEPYIHKARWPRRVMVDAAVYKHWLFMLHSAEYRIDKFDTRKAEVDLVKTRQYKRQKSKIEETGQDETDRELKGVRLPPSRYLWDIVGIYVFKDTLWVLTGKPEFSNSERLIDVFNMDGVYIDCFYLQFPDNGMRHFHGEWIVSDDGFLLTVDQDENGCISLGIYKITHLN